MHNNEHDCTGECADQGDCGCETTDDCCCEYEIQVNRPAPKFELEGVKKEEVKKYHLNDYKGKWVV
ncbi:hypothetical protein KJ705_06020, partial [Patescibacteria group bacterium]|nr:hypothetical protein [Patescibacteria group bacterium]